jgi:hypothetical protein
MVWVPFWLRVRTIRVVAADKQAPALDRVEEVMGAGLEFHEYALLE